MQQLINLRILKNAQFLTSLFSNFKFEELWYIFDE